MQLTFLGTGTSVGVPMIGCDCAVCTSPDPRNRRLRTSALLDVGGVRLLFDAGPDLREQALRAQFDQIDAVLLTHPHADHIGGIDDLRPFSRFGRCAVPMYGNNRTLHDLRQRYAYAFDPQPSLSTRPALELHLIEGPFNVGGVTITPVDVLHGNWTITGYRIGSLAYITDASALAPETLAQLHDLDVLVLNALRYTPHPLHFSLEQALHVVERLRPQRTYFIHIAHDLDHAAVSAQLPPGVALAYDGLSIKV
jgi:phosphoribosyl 1,2-cyclic phosphate phosphodiesterase